MIDLNATPIDTETRPGRMLAGLIASTNRGAKMLLTTTVTDATGETRYHEAFQIRRWNGRNGTMLTVSVAHSGSWADGVSKISVLHADVETGKLIEARDPRGADPVIRYAAKAALAYAWAGPAGLPTPRNGSVTVIESDTCAACGRELTDPVSIERGIGPECHGRATGSRTIRGRRRPEPQAETLGDPHAAQREALEAEARAELADELRLEAEAEGNGLPF